MNVFLLLSSLFMYRCSMSHSICSLIIFFGGMNMFLRISTSSVCNAALDRRFRIFMIFTIASCGENNGKIGREREGGRERESEREREREIVREGREKYALVWGCIIYWCTLEPHVYHRKHGELALQYKLSNTQQSQVTPSHIFTQSWHCKTTV